MGLFYGLLAYLLILGFAIFLNFFPFLLVLGVLWFYRRIQVPPRWVIWVRKYYFSTMMLLGYGWLFLMFAWLRDAALAVMFLFGLLVVLTPIWIGSVMWQIIKYLLGK